MSAWPHKRLKTNIKLSVLPHIGKLFNDCVHQGDSQADSVDYVLFLWEAATFAMAVFGSRLQSWKRPDKKTLADIRSRSVLLVTMTSMIVLGLDIFLLVSFWEDRWGEIVGSCVCLASCIPSLALFPCTCHCPILTTVICHWQCQHGTHFAGGKAASLIQGSVSVS